MPIDSHRWILRQCLGHIEADAYYFVHSGLIRRNSDAGELRSRGYYLDIIVVSWFDHSHFLVVDRFELRNTSDRSIVSSLNVMVNVIATLIHIHFDTDIIRTIVDVEVTGLNVARQSPGPDKQSDIVQTKGVSCARRVDVKRTSCHSSVVESNGVHSAIVEPLYVLRVHYDGSLVVYGSNLPTRNGYLIARIESPVVAGGIHSNT